jgi:hypothetical protein
MRQYIIHSRDAMLEFFSDVINVHGCLLHPDDSFLDMVDGEGKQAFDSETSSYLNQVIESCFNYCEHYGMDIYEQAAIIQLKEYKRIGLLPKDFGTDVEGD